MKNQYIGDIGDYGKYGLLRFLSSKGIRIGINWYLTKDDKSNDGKMTKYLENDNEAVYDSKLFYTLKDIAAKGTLKKVEDIESSDIIPNAVFFNETLNTSDTPDRKKRQAIRDAWHERAMEKLLNGTELIFADPDNGTLNFKRKPTVNNGEKYATVCELADYYRSEKDVVYYCHKARRSEVKWKEKMNELKQVFPDAKIIVLTFHRGTQRSYIFGIHPEHYDKYNKLIADFLKTDWGKTSVRKKNIPFEREL